jgi:hypothetical protein
MLQSNEDKKNQTLRRNNQILVVKLTELFLQDSNANVKMIVQNKNDPMLPKVTYKNCMKI